MKTNSFTAASSPVRPARRGVTHEAIARRAEQIWEEQGRPENCDQAIWLEAEAELLAIQQGVYRHPHLQLAD